MNLRAAVLLTALASPAGQPLEVSAGRLVPLGGGWYASSGEVRAEARERASSAELRFVVRGPSVVTTPLANGELRRQVGIKLRAESTCNVVYVTWHLAPTTGIHVSVKRNPGLTTHASCGDGGYLNVQPQRRSEPAAARTGELHELRATISGTTLTVMADGLLAWEGTLPPEAFTFDGPIGLRTDNVEASVSLRAH